MTEAMAWSLLGASSLLLGALAAFFLPIGKRLLGMIMGFGAGVLISAVAYELVEEAFATSSRGVALGLAAGSVTFFVGDGLIDRMGGDERKSMEGRQAGGVALALVLAIALGAILQSAVLGLGLLSGQGVSIAMLAAVFLSNLPEAAAATAGLAKAGWASARILALWTAVVAVSGLSSLAGYVFFDGASPTVLAFVLAFAGGSILTMLADTMMPEAFRLAGRSVGLVTTLGFAVAFAISSLE